MPVPATSHATSDPMTPVSRANVPGSENTPAPTIDPTTKLDRVSIDTLVRGAGAPPVGGTVSSVMRRL